ncbi:ABC transporter permease [Euzebya tangerina]|uniref:ABC transporter permease n=1 Tax=Euzebya tangerina TaxID=591198 RepID=UPI000E317EB0|nr:ABC transporter permease [Euzebya tangerina]
MTAATEPATSRLALRDLLGVGTHGLRTRKVRAALSALGIAIGIASLVGVLGLSESSRSDLIDQLDALGTNLLTLEAGSGFGTGDSELPDEALARVNRVGTVQTSAQLSELPDAPRRSSFVDEGITGGMTTYAVSGDLLGTVSGSVAAGTWLTDATEQYPGAVLGAVSAERLGVTDVHLSTGVSVTIGEVEVPVVGILDPFPLAADLDRGVYVGQQAASTFLDPDDALTPTRIYTRVADGQVEATREVLAATADPETPEEIQVSRPSDVLEAQAAADSQFASLFLALGGVALLVGGIGIANVMVIAVIERRSEIGLRRAIGATRAHIRRQFLTEALVLSVVGGLVGVAIGAGVTAGYATLEGWRIIIPSIGVVGGLAAAVLIGGVAGLYPAIRASRLSPTEALRA